MYLQGILIDTYPSMQEGIQNNECIESFDWGFKIFTIYNLFSCFVNVYLGQLPGSAVEVTRCLKFVTGLQANEDPRVAWTVGNIQDIW